MDPFNLAQGNLPRPRPFPAPTLPIQGTYDELLFPEKKEYIEATTDFLNQFEPQDTKVPDDGVEGRYTMRKRDFLNSHGFNLNAGIPNLGASIYPPLGTPERRLLDETNEEIKDTKFHKLVDGFQNKHIEDMAVMLESEGDVTQTLEGLGYETDFERV